MAHIPLNDNQIDRVKQLARDIAENVQAMIKDYSTDSVERTVLRLYGVDDVDADGTPLPNKIVDRLKQKGLLSSGISMHFAAAMLQSGRDAQKTAELIDLGEIDFQQNTGITQAEIKAQEEKLTQSALQALDHSRRQKEEKKAQYPLPPQPWRYLIVASGNIYEDRFQAESAVMSGADIIAVIRSTAQSLLDYIPYGPTTEGFGGTYATQANFRIMRQALDQMMDKGNRYLGLVNYASGLCMPEITACAAFEQLDMLLNDSMYGILFRDINKKRTFVDQYFSRLICARARIFINTGEDNYLTTADALEQAHTVTASQLINEALAQKAGVPEELMGLGHAFEIDPAVENALLYEIAHAQLARQLFPRSPIKYMPPTKYKSTDIFYSHCLDTMFNLVSTATSQGIHLAGMPTEAIHTPLMQDRYQSLCSINYVFHIAKSLNQELVFNPEGIICSRAKLVLQQTEDFLWEIRENGLMRAISEGKFAGISRPDGSGKGQEGVFAKAANYSNPLLDELQAQGAHNA